MFYNKLLEQSYPILLNKLGLLVNVLFILLLSKTLNCMYILEQQINKILDGIKVEYVYL